MNINPEEHHLRLQSVRKSYIECQCKYSKIDKLVVDIPSKACFAGAYEAKPTKDMYPNVEDTNTIFPPFLFSRAICLAAAYSRIRTRVKQRVKLLTHAVHAWTQ